MDAQTTTTRRMGPAGSANWLAMLDGAEDILREEGYAALTSRAVAERIGVKQRLVYYYFATMDDLIVETFRRLSVRELERMRQIAATPRPLHELWDVLITTTDARLITEFTALANRSEGLRVEVIAFIEQSRAIQVEALTAALKAKGRDTAIAPIGLVLLATSAALSLTREAELGVTAGHVELAGAIGAFLREVED
ncbi:TetR/AcrR family transcriptional regulator [Novosphingobium sp. G106]|uniref:TetR/AcrR family transcriptional regulator n=1 Tax=Novosphingobium sp. G106 TaxID=2849500 RepID=UPI0020C3A6BD|nr:TetR/AcrR family transcriptional regulator [Novosphingobium sp. G106]